MKVELKDVHADELSRFLQKLREHLSISLEDMESAAQHAMSDSGDDRRVFNDDFEIWIVE